jgi:hypothetical protein
MYPYFDVVVGLAWSNELESHAGSSATTGRASHAGQVKGDNPKKNKRYPGPSCCELGVGLTTHPLKICLFVEILLKLETEPKQQRQPSKKLRVGTRNVLSVPRSGALQNLIQVTQDYKIDLLAVQEVRWLGRSIIKKKDCVIYYSYYDKHPIFGTAVFVSKRIRSRVIDFKPIDNRLCAIRIRVNLKTVTESVPVHRRRKEVKERRNYFMSD